MNNRDIAKQADRPVAVFDIDIGKSFPLSIYLYEKYKGKMGKTLCSYINIYVYYGQ
jgi:hypothetical protein